MSNGHTRWDTVNLEMSMKHWYRVKLKISLRFPRRKYLEWRIKAPKTSRREDKNYKNISTRFSMWNKFWTAMQSDTLSRLQRSRLKNRNILKHSEKRSKKNDYFFYMIAKSIFSYKCILNIKGKVNLPPKFVYWSFTIPYCSLFIQLWLFSISIEVWGPAIVLSFFERSIVSR